MPIQSKGRGFCGGGEYMPLLAFLILLFFVFYSDSNKTYYEEVINTNDRISCYQDLKKILTNFKNEELLFLAGYKAYKKQTKTLKNLL